MLLMFREYCIIFTLSNLSTMVYNMKKCIVNITVIVGGSLLLYTFVSFIISLLSGSL